MSTWTLCHLLSPTALIQCGWHVSSYKPRLICPSPDVCGPFGQSGLHYPFIWAWIKYCSCVSTLWKERRYNFASNVGRCIEMPLQGFCCGQKSGRNRTACCPLELYWWLHKDRMIIFSMHIISLCCLFFMIERKRLNCSTTYEVLPFLFFSLAFMWCQGLIKCTGWYMQSNCSIAHFPSCSSVNSVIFYCAKNLWIIYVYGSEKNGEWKNLVPCRW